jgi:hypothetical protein
MAYLPDQKNQCTSFSGDKSVVSAKRVEINPDVRKLAANADGSIALSFGVAARNGRKPNSDGFRPWPVRLFPQVWSKPSTAAITDA